jgi:twitching motility protein PilJ
MIKSSPWPKLLPPLAIALAAILVVAAGVLTFGGGPAAAPDGGLGELIAVAQATRADARAALAGNAEAFGRLSSGAQDLAILRRDVGDDAAASPAARELVASAAWAGFEAEVAKLGSARERLLELHAARERLLELAPQLLAATANLASALPPADLATNKPYLERFELTVESLRQNVRALAAGTAVEESVQRLEDAEQFVDQIIRGLRGEDSSLGMTPVRGQTAQANLDAASRLFEQTRAAIRTIVAGGGELNAAAAAVASLDTAGATLLQRFRAIPAVAAPAQTQGWVARLPLALVVGAVLIVAFMMFVYYRARDFRRAAEIQAEQNERNQQAILRLLDELSSLADGDLTVQATVTEDITGAIADSINYAIEALRELVATINDSSILVDAASKQTENSARQLLRASETQAKQAAAASESMARMAVSIEEVSGNAERCSDVARHSVEIAHKGGEAVRRTIAGMNTIRETIQDTSKRIKRLGESSQEIGNIVELIEEIAEQTNILALNASIEASRAGEASRGFAVVADEVQKLAERSTNATKKIEVLVSTIQSDTNEAVVSMERSTTDVVGGALLAENAGAALDEIEQVSHQIASLVQNISGSSKEQASVAGAITKNMHVLREISSKTTESSAATTSAISKLAELASQLRKSVSGFALPDQSGGTGVLSAARVPAASVERVEPAPHPAEPTIAAAPPRRRLSG